MAYVTVKIGRDLTEKERETLLKGEIPHENGEIRVSVNQPGWQPEGSVLGTGSAAPADSSHPLPGVWPVSEVFVSGAEDEDNVRNWVAGVVGARDIR